MVFARGPWAHLFTGNFEQNRIPLAMAMAAGLSTDPPSERSAAAQRFDLTGQTTLATLALTSLAGIFRSIYQILANVLFGNTYASTRFVCNAISFVFFAAVYLYDYYSFSFTVYFKHTTEPTTTKSIILYKHHICKSCVLLYAFHAQLIYVMYLFYLDFHLTIPVNKNEFQIRSSDFKR